MIKYTLCLIRQGNKILLLNRDNPTWMGCWNGVGGKIESGELPRTSMLREIQEETQIDTLELYFKGLITWSTESGSGFGGLYLYLGEIPDDYPYQTPRKTDEGILDWKDIDWILHPENLGVASNIPSCLEKMLYDPVCYNHHSIFAGHTMLRQISTVIDPIIEKDIHEREKYFAQYLDESSGTR